MASLVHNPALRHRPGWVLGVGLGAFADGIVFHQVLRWHHFISDEQPTDTVAGLDANTLADGLFHVFAWLVLVAGLVLFFRSARAGVVPRGRVFAGSLIAGAALFNVADVLLAHWLLGLHHIHQGDYELLSDVVYFAASLGLLAGGLALAARGPQPPPA